MLYAFISDVTLLVIVYGRSVFMVLSPGKSKEMLILLCVEHLASNMLTLLLICSTLLTVVYSARLFLLLGYRCGKYELGGEMVPYMFAFVIYMRVRAEKCYVRPGVG